MDSRKAVGLILALWMIQGAATRGLGSAVQTNAGRGLKTWTDITLAYASCPRVTCSYDAKTRAYTNCAWAFPDMICCGGDTGVICPALACSYAFTSALSAPGGCAQAEAQVSSISVNPTVYKAVGQQLKAYFTFLAVEEQMTQAQFFDTLTVVAKTTAKAVSLSCVKGFEYVCAKPVATCATSCPKCGSALPSGAQSIVYGLAQSVSRAIAQTVAEAWYEVFSGHPGYEVFAGEAFAIGAGVADATNVAIAKMNKQYLALSKDALCQKDNLQTEFEQAFTLAFVCNVARATVLYFGDEGGFFSNPVNASATNTSGLALASCTSSISAAYSVGPVTNFLGYLDAAYKCEKRCDCAAGQVAVVDKDGKDFCIPFGLVTTKTSTDIQPSTLCFNNLTSSGATALPTCASTVSVTRSLPLPTLTTGVQLKCKVTNGGLFSGKSIKVEVFGTRPGASGPEAFSATIGTHSLTSLQFFGAYYSGPNGYLTSVKVTPSNGATFCCQEFKSSACAVDFPPAGACGGANCY